MPPTYAGAVLATDSNLTFLDCAFINNTGSQTGAVSLTGGTLQINDTMFIGNNGPQVGCSALQKCGSSTFLFLLYIRCGSAVAAYGFLKLCCNELQPIRQWHACASLNPLLVQV